MKLTKFLKEAMHLLLKEPKLFIPKIAVSLLYSVVMLLLSFLLVTHKDIIFLASSGGALSYGQLQDVSVLLFSLLFLLVLSLIMLVIDILVNAMYPVLVNDFYSKGKLSLKRAFLIAMKNSRRVVPTFFIIVILLSVPTAILNSYVLKAHSLTDSLIIALVTLGIYFALLILFYFLYPAIMLNKRSLSRCFSENFILARKNIGIVAKASLIPFIASLISFVFAFVSALEPLLILLFLVYRTLIAIMFTYHMVLSPAIYLKVRSQ